MISDTIKNIKKFMNSLLASNYFDSFLVNSVSITTYGTFQIDGHLKKDFYTSEEWDAMQEHTYTSYETIRPICYDLIKGKKLPLNFKMIFSLNKEERNKLLESTETTLTAEDIKDLFLNIKYDAGTVTYTTGTSYKIFTMDKSLDQAFDKYIQTKLEPFYTTTV